MKNDTENALTFMDHHHKMYSHLFSQGDQSQRFPQYLYALGIEAKVPWLIEDLSACSCCDDRDRDRDQVKRPTSLEDDTKTKTIDPFIRPWPPIPEIPETPETQVTQEVLDDYPCSCRRYIRHLCRAY